MTEEASVSELDAEVSDEDAEEEEDFLAEDIVPYRGNTMTDDEF